MKLWRKRDLLRTFTLFEVLKKNVVFSKHKMEMF